MQIAWETVGNIIERVWARRQREDLLDGLTHIGIDEISYKRHHQYPTVMRTLGPHSCGERTFRPDRAGDPPRGGCFDAAVETRAAFR